MHFYLVLRGVYMLKSLFSIGILAIVVSIPCSFAGDINAGLISYFPLNNNTLDVSENGYHAMLANGGFVEDHNGNQNSALYGSLKYPTSDIVAPSKFSVAMWLKMDYVYDAFGCFVGNGYDEGFGFGISADGSVECPAPPGVNRVFAIFIGGVAVLSSNTVTLSCEDGWVHVAITFDDETDTVQIYLNGVLADTLTNTGTMSPTGSPVSFGKDSKWNDTFHGSLDEVRFYNRVITAEEANELYTFDGYNTTLFLPHFDITEGSWKTSVMFFNVNSGSARGEFSVIDNNGNFASSAGFDLQKFMSYEFKLDEYLPLVSDPTKNGWLQIKSNSYGLTGLMKFTFIPTGATSSLPLVSDVGYTVSLPLLEWSSEYKSGFAIVNTGNYHINVALHLRDKNGNTLDEIKYQDIAPWSKIVMMLDGMFNPSTFKDQMTLVATCDDYPTITGFALTFNGDNTEIVAVPGNIFNY